LIQSFVIRALQAFPGWLCCGEWGEPAEAVFRGLSKVRDPAFFAVGTKSMGSVKIHENNQGWEILWFVDTKGCFLEGILMPNCSDCQKTHVELGTLNLPTSLHVEHTAVRDPMPMLYVSEVNQKGLGQNFQVSSYLCRCITLQTDRQI
jgi:hypothetical protein